MTMDVVVEYDYAAQEMDELNLKKGEVISNVVKVQEGWCQGVLNDKKGMFPDNFVKEIKKTDKHRDGMRKKSTNSSVEDIRSKLEVVINNPPPSYASHNQNVTRKVVKQARVTFDYEPQNEDELALEIGQIVDIINEVEPGWWECSLNGRVGMLPSNFVEHYNPPSQEETAYSSTTGEPKTPASSDYFEIPEIKGRKVTGVGFGPNIFGKGEIILKPTNRGVSSPTQVAIVTAASPTSIASAHISVPFAAPPNKKKPMALPDKETKQVVKAKVVYAYKAENPDELSLQVGEVIQVLDQNVEDVGWWKGQVKGKVGVFPDNFVQLLPQEEPRVPSSRPKKPLDPPLHKPSFNILKPKNVPKSNEPPEVMKTDFMVNKGPPKRPPVVTASVNKETSKESLKSPPVFNKVKNWENQDHPQNNIPPSSSSSSTSQIPPILSPTSSTRKTSQPPLQKAKNTNPDIQQVTREMMSDLQREVGQLKDQLERMKRDHEKNLLNLMAEIDEEKKTRFNMQVEIERLKKLLSSFSSLDHPIVTKPL